MKIIIESEEARKFLIKKNANTKSEVTKGLNNAALFLQGEVKESIAGRRQEKTSVDTGRFLNSVDMSVGTDNAVIFTNLPYAEFLEWGTSRISPRRHFNNSKDRNKGKIKDIIETQIKNI